MFRPRETLLTRIRKVDPRLETTLGNDDCILQMLLVKEGILHS